MQDLESLTTVLTPKLFRLNLKSLAHLFFPYLNCEILHECVLTFSGAIQPEGKYHLKQMVAQSDLGKKASAAEGVVNESMQPFGYSQRS